MSSGADRVEALSRAVRWGSLALALGAAAPPAPRPVSVPAALAAVTSAPELSGLAWSPALARYLVVSDDTGLEARGTRRAPFVLAMDTAGALDAAPVPIAGVDALDDAEAICAGPDGTFFVTTSHSPNRKGKTRPARRQLLHLRLEGRSLARLGRLDLTAIEGGSLLGVAGLPEDGRLDVEALAWRDGALFIGLKSPLTGGGAAVVLRLSHPLEALRAGRVEARALERWAALPLCVEAGGGRVCQGLADMTFLDDGSMVAAGNAPKGQAEDGGGAVWWLPAPVGTAAPRLVHRLQGARPEGVALSPDRRRLVVVLDRDQRAPRWLELPLPGPR